ncbi:MAG: aspartate/glutamate racemase family protein [Proteobacteria bacterium]|nr:aspartate/glutamate racemase family protein [Pseudomonadota bacterium]
MPAILAINPNTTATVTSLVERHLRGAAPGVDWRMATGRFGARYIVSEASFAIASHAALDAWAEHGEGCDAVLLACFGDPGLFALRELSPVPVIGLAEASMLAAAERAPRFSIVTGGPRWAPILERLALCLGFGARLVSVRTTEITGGQAAAEPDRAVAALAQACRDARDQDGAEAVILGGAGFAGLAARVEPVAGIAVIDSVLAGAKAAERLAMGAPCPYARRAGAKHTDSTGLAVTLADRLLE